jgi:hypothetical protein
MDEKRGRHAPVPRAQLCKQHLLAAALALRSAKPIAEAMRDGAPDDIQKLYYEIDDALAIVTQCMRVLDPELCSVLQVTG